MTTSTNQPVSAEVQSLLDDPFYGPDVNLDMAGFSPELREKLRPTKKDDWGDLAPEIVRSPREEYAAMLADPDVRKELAERDPAFAGRYADEQMESIVAEFRRMNPSYLKTAKNAGVVIGGLAKRYLGKDWLDNDDAMAELYSIGKWTTAELTGEYQRAASSGLLDVPVGTAKPLSRREELDVIATLRSAGTEAALTTYLKYAIGGTLPHKYRSK